MRHIATWSLSSVLCLAAFGCASNPVPAERLARSEAAIRSAREVGADHVPSAALHLRLAQDQLDNARRLIDDGQNGKAAWVLMRAEADAEVALSLSREEGAKAQVQKTLDEVRDLKQKSGPASEGGHS